MFPPRHDRKRNPGQAKLTPLTIERAFTILAALLVIAAVICLWRDNVSAAFVTATLGVVTWFLGYRFRLRANLHLTDDDGSDENENRTDD